MAPDTRMDLALPSDLPLADLLPTLLFHAGQQLADDGVSHGGWALSRVGGAPLDTGRTPAQLEVRDGEVLFLTPRVNAAPEVVFDDVVDAVATATLERPGRWTVASTRRFATGLATVALLAGAAAVLLAGPPQLPSALTGLGLGLAVLLGATVIARVAGDGALGARFGLVALVYVGIGGLLLLAGEQSVSGLGAVHVLLAATALMIASAVASVAIGDRPQLFLGGIILGGMVSAGAVLSLTTQTGPAVPAVVIGTVAFAIFPALPMLSYRAARLPLPAVPAGPDDLRADTEQVESRRVLLLSDRAEAFHTGLINTVAILVAGSGVVVVFTAGWPGWVFGSVLGLLLLLRARPYRGWAGRTPVLVAGCAVLAAVGGAGFLTADPLARIGLVVGAALAAAAVSLGYGLGVAGRRISPVWGRLLDIGEVMLIISVVPLAAWIGGLFEWIATIRN